MKSTHSKDSIFACLLACLLHSFQIAFKMLYRDLGHRRARSFTSRSAYKMSADLIVVS